MDISAGICTRAFLSLKQNLLLKAKTPVPGRGCGHDLPVQNFQRGGPGGDSAVRGGAVTHAGDLQGLQCPHRRLPLPGAGVDGAGGYPLTVFYLPASGAAADRN